MITKGTVVTHYVDEDREYDGVVLEVFEEKGTARVRFNGGAGGWVETVPLSELEEN